MRVSSALEAGTVGVMLTSVSLSPRDISNNFAFQVWINQYNLLYNNVPFGGKKQSGIGGSSLRP